jgi:hypothetical protein
MARRRASAWRVFLVRYSSIPSGSISRSCHSEKWGERCESPQARGLMLVSLSSALLQESSGKGSEAGIRLAPPAAPTAPSRLDP